MPKATTVKTTTKKQQVLGHLIKFIIVCLYSLSWRTSLAFEKTELVSPFTKETFEVSVLSEQELNDLFNYLSTRTSIPYHVILDGCYARAYLMNSAAAIKQITLAKRVVEVINNETETIIIPSQDRKWQLRWYYHVAPIAQVRLRSGEIVERVLDPSLFKKPVSTETFLKKLTAANPKVEIDTFILPKYIIEKDQHISEINFQKLDSAMLQQLTIVQHMHSEHGQYHEKKPLFDEMRGKWYQGGWVVHPDLLMKDHF